LRRGWPEFQVPAKRNKSIDIPCERQ